MWSVLVFPVGIFSGFSSFLPKSKGMHVSLTSDSKLSVEFAQLSASLCLPYDGPVLMQRAFASRMVTATIGSRV